jgi:hypothetical protein
MQSIYATKSSFFYINPVKIVMDKFEFKTGQVHYSIYSGVEVVKYSWLAKTILNR